MAGLTKVPEPFTRAVVVLPRVVGAAAGRSRMAGPAAALAGH